jgi:hypothetical protein
VRAAQAVARAEVCLDAQGVLDGVLDQPPMGVEAERRGGDRQDRGELWETAVRQQMRPA